jgi:peptidoglycan/LPS O-acetylase OafA/YrhL
MSDLCESLTTGATVLGAAHLGALSFDPELKSEAPVVTSRTRLPELDGIRGLAILMVLVWHYLVGPTAQSSSHVLRFFRQFGIETWSGVDLFFVLSGFLIGGILIDSKGSSRYFATFYLRRVFRILPIYLLLCGSFPLWRLLFQLANKTNMLAMPWPVYATFTQNFWLAHHSWDVWMNPTWSLAVEEQFYLLLPLMVWALPKQLLWKAALATTLACLVFRSSMYLRFYPQWGEAAYTLIFCRGDALMLGVLGAVVVRSPHWLAELKRRRQMLSLVIAALPLLAVLVSLRGWGMMTVPTSTIGYSLIALSYLILILGVVLNDGILKRIFCTRWLRELGTIAYGVYLLHAPLLALVYASFGYRQPQIAKPFDLIPMFVALAMSLAMAYLSWTYFESGLVRFAREITSRQLELRVAA